MLSIGTRVQWPGVHEGGSIVGMNSRGIQLIWDDAVQPIEIHYDYAYLFPFDGQDARIVVIPPADVTPVPQRHHGSDVSVTCARMIGAMEYRLADTYDSVTLAMVENSAGHEDSVAFHLDWIKGRIESLAERLDDLADSDHGIKGDYLRAHIANRKQHPRTTT